MTVLVLDLVRAYEQHIVVGPADCGVYCHMREVGGLICGYSVTFGVLGMIWAAHHQIFRAVGRHDFKLIVCNLFHLAFTVAVPFTAFIWGSSLSTLFDVTRWDILRESATVYALNVGMTALTLCILWYYVSHDNRLTYRDRVTERGAYYTARLWIPTVVFFLCALVAQVQPFIAYVALVLNWLTSVFFLRRILAWTHRFPYLPSTVVDAPHVPPEPPRPPAEATSQTASEGSIEGAGRSVT